MSSSPPPSTINVVAAMVSCLSSSATSPVSGSMLRRYIVADVVRVLIASLK